MYKWIIIIKTKSNDLNWKHIKVDLKNQEYFTLTKCKILTQKLLYMTIVLEEVYVDICLVVWSNMNLNGQL